MEKHEKEYLIQIQVELMEMLQVNSILIAELQSKDVIGKADITNLESIKNATDKNKELINILINRVNGYNLFMEALKKTNQSGVLRLLEQIPKVPNVQEKSTSSTQRGAAQAASGTNSKKVKYPLNIDEEDVVNTVLPKVQNGLVNKMDDQETNTYIISEVSSLGFFDFKTITPFLSGTHASQRDRMNGLFRIIAALDDDDEILLCLERLCNLKEYPRAATKFRKVLNEHFEGCV